MISDNKKQVVSSKVASVSISFDGQKYSANLGRSNMSGEGWLYFLQVHADQVAEIKTYLFAKHISKFGWNEQTEPDTIGLETQE